MKFIKRKMVSILELMSQRSLMMTIWSKNLLHIDTPKCRHKRAYISTQCSLMIDWLIVVDGYRHKRAYISTQGLLMIDYCWWIQAQKSLHQHSRFIDDCLSDWCRHKSSYISTQASLMIDYLMSILLNIVIFVFSCLVRG